MGDWNKSRFAKYRKTHPWIRLVEWARRRCNDTDPEGWWPLYGAKGITCELTGAQAKALWERDGGWKLVKPSLDRVDALKGYTFENCRITEFKFNARRAWDPTCTDDRMAEFR